ncbi:MAG TPA: hypothetical protein V6D47_19090 [Oscillatoriaceae cyanobacterium]
MSKTKKKAKSKSRAKAPRPMEEAPRSKKSWSVIAGAVLAVLLVLGLVATAIVPFFQG